MGLKITKINAGGVEYDISDANAKTKQTAVSDPTAGSTATAAFINSISQNENGEITVTKQPVGGLAAGAITTGTLGVARGGTGASSFTAGKVVVSNGSSTTGALTTSSISTTELGYLSGVSSNIQDQIDALSGGQSGGTDHLRFIKATNIESSTTAISGVGTASGSTITWNGIVGGKTVKVGDIVVGKNYGLGSVTEIITNGSTVSINITYLGVFTTVNDACTYDSANFKLTLPTTGKLTFTAAS